MLLGAEGRILISLLAANLNANRDNYFSGC